MIRFALLFSVLSAVLCQGQQQANDQQKCAVEGRVISATTGEPLRKVYVGLYPSPDNSDREANSFSTRTDARGHFLFANVTPGIYGLTALLRGNHQ